MTLPTGVTTCNVIFNTPLSYAGGIGIATLTVRPTQTIIWAATGQPLGVFTDTVTTSAQPGNIQLPHVDQPGFVDSTGKAVTNWAYQADVLWTIGAQNAAIHKAFQVVTGQSSVTLELIPDGNTSIAVTAPVAAVTSVAGLTGPVSTSQIVTALGSTYATPAAVTAAVAPKLNTADLDTTTATNINTPGSNTTAALNATFVNKPSGITDGQVPVWDATAGKFKTGAAGVGTAPRVIADRGRNSLNAKTTTSTGNQTKTDRTQHTVRADATSLQMSYGNAGINVVGANDIVIGAAFELEQVVYPVTFGGAARVTITPGAIVISDPLPNTVTVKAGQKIYVRTYVSVATIGQKYPDVAGYYLRTFRQEATTAGTSGADLTITGSTLTGFTQTNGGGLPPLGIIGVATSTTASLGIFGDSIAAGYQDDYWGGNATGGFLDRFAVANALPFVNYSLGGDMFAKMNTDTVRGWRYGPELGGITHGVCEYGVNDVVTFTLSSLKTNAIAYWTYLKNKSVKLYQTTLTPYSTSTDSWTTTTNQSVKSFEAVRTGFNDWVRDGAPITSGVGAAPATFANNTIRAGDPSHPLMGYIEIADSVETVRNSGIWQANYTPDGLHPNPAANIVIAASMNRASLGL